MADEMNDINEEKAMREHAREGAKSAMRVAQTRFQRAKEQVVGAIEDEPVNAAMVAGGIGFILGVALTAAIMGKCRREM